MILSDTHVVVSYKGLDIATKQMLDSLGSITKINAENAKTAIQDMLDHYQMWHDGASNTRKNGSSSKILAVITSQLNCPNKEQFKEANEVYYEEFYQRPYLNRGRYIANAPDYYVKDKKKMGYQDKRPSLEETLNKFMVESAKKDKENTNLITEVQASTQAAMRNNEATLKSMENQTDKQISYDEELKKKGPIAKGVVAPYQPPIPFASRLVERNSVDQDADVFTSLKRLKVNIPHVEPLREMSGYSRYLEDLLKNKSRIVDDEEEKMNEYKKVSYDEELKRRDLSLRATYKMRALTSWRLTQICFVMSHHLRINSIAPDSPNNNDTTSSTTIIIDEDEAPHIVSTFEEQTPP
nr:hypothetical protein [Tanacetum cinerariifolium]